MLITGDWRSGDGGAARQRGEFVEERREVQVRLRTLQACKQDSKQW